MDYEVAECINGEYVFPSERKKKEALKKAALITAGSAPIVIPTMAFAEGGGETFNSLFQNALRAADAGLVFVVMFAGVSWILGNRSKALEILLYSSAGYLVLRNAVHIRDFLKSLAPDPGVVY